MNRRPKSSLTNSSWRLAACLSALIGSSAAEAALYTEPYVTAAVENDSNVFRFENKDEAEASNGGQPVTQLGDTLFRYAGGLNADYTWGRQRLYASGEGRRTVYENFSQLDNNSYLWYGGLDFKLFQFIDGVIEHRQERRLASFENRDTTVPEKEMEFDDRLELNFAITPDWRLETGAANRNDQSPLADAPQFALRETSYRSTIKYLGLGDITGGLEGRYVSGSYSGQVDQPADSTYIERGAGLAVEDKISGLSTLNGGIDYTRRTNQGAGSSKFSGVTGNLAYLRKLSGKSDFDVHIYRRTSSYNVAASSIIETGAGLGFNWTPTDKIKATARYDYSSQKYQNQSTASSADAGNRKDHLNTATLNAGYDVLKWLNAQTYLNYNFRGTNAQNAEYRDLIVGLQITLTYEHGEKP